jgi:DNA-binding NtrC family response regulator
VLQEGEVRPLGSNEVRKVDVRVIAATHRDLGAAIASGGFREDLFYRLNVFSIQLPPLRDRSGDLPLLLRHFADKYAARHGRTIGSIDPAAAMLLLSHRWPGNVRELENVIQRAVLLAPGEILTAAAIRDAMPATVAPEVTAPAEAPEPAISPAPRAPATGEGAPLLPFAIAREQAIDEWARAYLAEALRRSGGRVVDAAALVDVERSNFRRLLRRYDIDPAGFRD